MGAWSSGGNLATARDRLGGCGTQTAGLSFGGYTGSASNVTEEYNGTSWSAGGNLGTARFWIGGCGTQIAGLSFGGQSGGTYYNTTEEYDGTSWSAGGNVYRGQGSGEGGAGTQTAGLLFGGDYDSSGYRYPAPWTDEYNGTTWSGGGDLATARDHVGGAGSQTAGLSFGGSDPFATTYSSATEEYNGTAWGAGGGLSQTKHRVAGAGTQTDGLCFGGYRPNAFLDVTEEYNGTSWSAGGSLNTGRSDLGGCGSGVVSALSFGGTSTGSNQVVTTEEYGPAAGVSPSSSTSASLSPSSSASRSVSPSSSSSASPSATPSSSTSPSASSSPSLSPSASNSPSISPSSSVSASVSPSASASPSTPPVVAPTVTTQDATDVAALTATGNGNITNTGGENADKRGVVYSTSTHADPGNIAPVNTAYEGYVEATGSFGTGAFTSSLTGLACRTVYYARAYAHNSQGYSYGGEVTFTTIGFTNPGNVYTSNDVYATVAAISGALQVELSKDGGTNWQAPLSKTFGASDTLETYGAGSTELWGSGWVGDDLDNTSFRLKVTHGSISQIYKNFGFTVAAGTILTGIEVAIEAKYASSTISIDLIKVKIYYGSSILPIVAGSQAYATNGRRPGEGAGNGTGLLVYFDGSNWISCIDGATVAA